MYLEHFGLSSPPFKITPVTGFFFPGANRGEILDALVYAITQGEGIIKVTGEVGSGKTMLCRMLLERLPPQMEPVYLANPSLSREEMLYAIADSLGLKLEGQRVNVIMQTLQNLLERKSAEGKRVVVLVDEAHAMPPDTLEELRLLYNLQVGDHKLMHIVLFGQQELDDKLTQPNMRQLKDRIVHHFSMLPLSQSAIATYLLFRMQTAGYRGPNVFSPEAIQLISKASSGLMRRVNVLADKSLLAAFIGNTHQIEAHHVRAAIRDSEFTPHRKEYGKKGLVVGAILLVLIFVAAAGWFVAVNPGAQLPAAPQAAVTPPPDPPPAAQSGMTPATELPAEVHPPAAEPAAVAEPATLLEQRLAATRSKWASPSPMRASIQLFYTTEPHSARIEDFLARAEKLGTLPDIYVTPDRIKGRDGLRVLYGAYPDMATARAAISNLPPRYRNGFAPAPYLLDSVQPLARH